MDGSRPARPPRVVVAIPCLNEAGAIAGVIAEMQENLPDAEIVVIDNGSSDGTARVAADAGARVLIEPRKGKGNAVARVLETCEFDVLLLTDGDGTYDARDAPRLVDAVVNGGQHLVVASRAFAPEAKERERPGHRIGNSMFKVALGVAFGESVEDAFSGFRAMSRPFADVFPCESEGFEIEAEITAHALTLRVPWQEFPSPYAPRAEEAGDSKLRTFRDGWRIMRSVLKLWRWTRPLLLFSILGIVPILAGLGFGIDVIVEFAQTGLVPRLPTAILSGLLVLLGAILVLVGVILDVAVSQSRRAARSNFMRRSRRWRAELNGETFPDSADDYAPVRGRREA